MEVVRETTTECVKVDALRKKHGKEMDLRQWCANPDNVLCCRNGRVFIHTPDPENPNVKKQEVFTYSKSKWCNPFKEGVDGTLAEVCQKFENYILTSELRNDLGELVGKNLGCFCDQKNQCHTQTLARLVALRDNLPEPTEVTTTAPVKSNKKPTSTENRCQAQTQKKTQCTRKANSDGQYCGQHAAMNKKQ